MKIYNAVKFILSSRGVLGVPRRLLAVSRRFGLTASRQIERLDHYMAILERHKVRGTFFMPAVLMKKYYNELRKIDMHQMEWGLHSDVHSDLSAMNHETQRLHIRNAIEIFNALGIAFYGFRAPYLKTNQYTLEILQGESKLLYDSSQSIIWDDIYGCGAGFRKWVDGFYCPESHSQNRSQPEIYKGLVKIPVTLPDDDMLIDREKLDANSVLSVWSSILEACYNKGEIFVLQLHPERIFDLSDVLSALIKRAKEFTPPIWIAPLSEVAKWQHKMLQGEIWPEPYRAAFCITGDIDAITIIDFIDRLKTW